MAGRTAILAVKVIADTKNANAGLEGTGKAADKAGGRMSKVKGPALAAVGAIALLGKSSLDAASNLQQSTGAVQSVYGKFAGSIIKNAKAAAGAVGLSQAAYQQQAVLLGSQLKNLGTPMDQVAGKTTGLIKKASDLAATFGGSTADAVEAIGSLMRGETDPIERYGVSINQAGVQAYILAHKLPHATAAQQKQAKATATLALLTKQTSAATGQFARETTTVAGASEIAAAKWENARAKLGTKLLPVVAKAKTLFAGMAGFVERNSTVVFALAGVLGVAALAVLSINAAVKAWSATTRAFTAVQKALNLVMSMNPVARVVLIIAALAAALIVAYKKSETFRDIVNAAFLAVRAAVTPVVDFFVRDIPHAFQAVVTGLHAAWNAAVAFLKVWGPRALIVLAPFIGIPLLIYRHFGQIVGWIAGVWRSVIAGISTFVGSAVRGVTSLPTRIAGLAGRMLTAGGKIMGQLFQGMKNALSGAGSFAQDIAHDIVNALIRAINKFLSLPIRLPRVNTHIPGVGTIGGQTILPAIPLWNAAALVDDVTGPARRAAGAPVRDVRDLRPGFSLAGAGGVSGAWPTLFAGSTAGSSTTIVDRRRFVLNFPGVVTDPEAVASKLRKIARQSDDRNGLTRRAATLSV